MNVQYPPKQSKWLLSYLSGYSMVGRRSTKENIFPHNIMSIFVRLSMVTCFKKLYPQYSNNWV